MSPGPARPQLVTAGAQDLSITSGKRLRQPECEICAPGAGEYGGVAVRAVAFDIGGVLERVAPMEQWLGPWRERLGMGEAEFVSALRRVDPDAVISTGGLTEAEYAQRYADALGLSDALLNEFMAGLWDWYCGRPGHRAHRVRGRTAPRPPDRDPD
jgi:hypothetical protein